MAPSSTPWLHDWNKGCPGLYLCFQIPSAHRLSRREGLRPQWREAARHSARDDGPIGARVASADPVPVSVGATLPLSTNAFSAYATAAALAYPDRAAAARSSRSPAPSPAETVLGQANVGRPWHRRW